MSVNKEKPHLYILPEDDENRELANGFINNLWVNDRQVQVLPVAGGWRTVLEKFKVEYIPHLNTYRDANIVLLIDFDQKHESRFSSFTEEIPDRFKDRVFVIGVKDEPKDLKRALNLTKNFEEIGSALADDCHDNTTKMWGHPHLSHNEPERIRLMEAVMPILFGS